jgi:phage-related minor tail protein
MDWPGAQEMAKRFAKTIDPKLMNDSDENPALQAAQQQMQAMGQEMEQMHQMLQHVNQSVEVQDMKRKDFEAQVKAYEAETKRLAQVQASMSPEQIQDIVMGTVHGMITSGDLIGEMPGRDVDVGAEMPQEGMEMMPPEQQMMPPEQQMGMPQ